MTSLVLFLSLGVIILGAEIFTNGIEWFGKKLKLGEGAVGSVLAAVGTALPETMIPVTALLFGRGEEATHVGIGAILGAPFMLATLAMLITGVSALIFKVNGKRRTSMRCDISIISRDLFFFILVYTVALAAAFIKVPKAKTVLAAFLVCAYVFYALHTLMAGQNPSEGKVRSLFFGGQNPNPSLSLVLLQVIIALGIIVTGAHVFVGVITRLSLAWGIPAFLLAIIIAPIATELPEKFNSIVWVRQGKDTLALGNITGAMVFQSSLLPALGILFTPWKLSPLALTSGVLALTSAMIICYNLQVKKRLRPKTLIGVGSLYLVFFAIVLISTGKIQ